MSKFPLTCIHRGKKDYPPALLFRLGQNAPASLAAVGSADLLRRKTLALICSAKCPGSIILNTYELAKKLARAEVPLVSGFHSPMEKECLNVYLRIGMPVVMVLARPIARLRIGTEWKAPIREGRMLIISPFAKGSPRVSAALAERRNLIVAALADRVFIPYAGAGSKTMVLAKTVEAWAVPIYTLTDPRNDALRRLDGIADAVELPKFPKSERPG